MSVQSYREMADDAHRLAAFRREIASVVRPGDVVADIGCGLANFSVYACEAGARLVFAIEADAIIEVAGEVVRANGWGERVRFLHGASTEIEVPGPVDVAIFEDYELGLLSPSVIRTLVDLRTRWLRPGGRLVPSRARRLACPVEDPSGRAALDLFGAAGDHVLGVDLSPARRRAFAAAHHRALPAHAALGPAWQLDAIDLLAATSPGVWHRGAWSPSRSGEVHGIAVWFQLDLGGEWLDTGPGSTSAWQQLVLPIDPPLSVERGAPLEVEVDAHAIGDLLHWRWQLTLDGEARGGNTLEGLPLAPRHVQQARPGYVPRPGQDLEIERTLLEHIDGQRSVEALSIVLAARFPGRFPDAAAARAFVLPVIARVCP